MSSPRTKLSAASSYRHRRLRELLAAEHGLANARLAQYAEEHPRLQRAVECEAENPMQEEQTLAEMQQDAQNWDMLEDLEGNIASASEAESEVRW